MSPVDVPDIPRAGAVALPADSSAVIVVDMQNDFATRRARSTARTPATPSPSSPI